MELGTVSSLGMFCTFICSDGINRATLSIARGANDQLVGQCHLLGRHEGLGGLSPAEKYHDPVS